MAVQTTWFAQPCSPLQTPHTGCVGPVLIHALGFGKCACQVVIGLLGAVGRMCGKTAHDAHAHSMMFLGVAALGKAGPC